MLTPKKEIFEDIFAARGLTPKEAYAYRHKAIPTTQFYNHPKGITFKRNILTKSVTILADRMYFYLASYGIKKNPIVLDRPGWNSAANLFCPATIPIEKILPFCISDNTREALKKYLYLGIKTLKIDRSTNGTVPRIGQHVATYYAIIPSVSHIYLARVVDGTPDKRGFHTAYWIRVPPIMGPQVDSGIAWTYGIEVHSLQTSVRT